MGEFSVSEIKCKAPANAGWAMSVVVIAIAKGASLEKQKFLRGEFVFIGIHLGRNSQSFPLAPKMRVALRWSVKD